MKIRGDDDDCVDIFVCACYITRREKKRKTESESEGVRKGVFCVLAWGR